MKKITLFIFLMAFSLGYSQSLPFNFSTANQLFVGDFCVTSLTTDAGDDVMQIVGNGDNFDNAQKVLAQNVNLADNANNTITFRFKQTSATGSGSHLLKFEGGTTANVELPFTSTAGSGWQNVSLNFGAGLGNYSKIVIFTDFNNASVGTYLIDDIAGGTNVAPLAVPSGPAPIPTLAPADVISVYGDVPGYPNTYQYSFGTISGEPDLDPTAATNLALKFDFSFAGFGAGYTETNLTTANVQYVHFDYWTTNATTFNLYLISNSPVVERIYTISVNEPIVLNTWKSVNIPLSYFTNLGFNPATWFQYKFDVASITPGIVYIDNLYFSKLPLGTEEFESSDVKMYPNPTSSNLTIESSIEMDTIAVYNLLGQEIMKVSPSATVSTINVSSLESGIYIVKATAEGITSSKRFIKK